MFKRILIDGDACPVIDSIVEHTEGTGISVLILRSYSHFSLNNYPEHVEVTYVDDGPDAVDYKLLAISRPTDLVITQDYGLASLLLDKVYQVRHHNGKLYNSKNIQQLLDQRHQSSQLRRSGVRTKGPSKFSAEQRRQFERVLQRLIEQDTR